MEGWALVYSDFSHQQPPDLNAKEKWIKLFLKIERGELRCSLTQQAAWPLAIFYLTAANIATATQQEAQLIKLILRDDVHVWVIPEALANEDEWLFAVTEQADFPTVLPVAELNKAAAELRQYLDDVVNEAMPAVGVMEVTLSGEVHRLPITLEDNTKVVCEQFAREHQLKPSVANTLELELLRTQVDASKEKIAALKEANKWLRVTLLEASTLRQKVAQADVRIQTLEAELAAVETTVPKLDAILEEFMSQNNALQSECEELNERLQEMQEERESHEAADRTNEQRVRKQLTEAERQIRELNAQVQDLSQQLATANAARSANLMPAPLVGNATAQDMFTPQPNARTPDYIKSDRFAPAAGSASPKMHAAPPNTAPARILSRAERRALWTPLTIGVTTGRVTETMSPDKLAATNKELKAKLRNSKQLREQYAEKVTALQQTAQSYQESAQEAEREVKKLQKKIHKLQESMEHRCMVKMQEENKLLKQQMLDMKGEMVRLARALAASQAQQHAASQGQSDVAAQREQPLVTTPVSETTVKALPLTASVQSHVLRVIFDKYAVNEVMTRFKFQQFTREYDIISETDLVAGDVDVLFAFILRTTQTKKSVLPKQPMKPVGPYKPDMSEPQHNLIDIDQFESLLSVLALRLYLPVLEKESHTHFYLLEDHEHDTVTTAAVEILYKEKLIPKAHLDGLIRWAGIYIAETKTAYMTNELLLEQVSNKSAILFKLFSQYTSTTGQQMQISTTDDGASTARTDDTATEHMTFRTLSQFARDFGICPMLVQMDRLYELYSELDAETAQQPQQIGAHVAWAHSNTSLPVEPNRLNYAQFVAFLAVIAHQYFPDTDPLLRMHELLRWMDKSGGFQMLQQHESAVTNDGHVNSKNPFA